METNMIQKGIGGMAKGDGVVAIHHVPVIVDPFGAHKICIKRKWCIHQALSYLKSTAPTLQSVQAGLWINGKKL
jgi:hypothetical protein